MNELAAINRLIDLGWMKPVEAGDEFNFTAALTEYQQWAGLPASGVLDELTVGSLQRPRVCGMADKITVGELRRNPLATWEFVGPSLATVSVDETLQEIQESFDKWSRVAPIRATRAVSGQTPSIRIMVTTLDGRNGVLADCELPGPVIQKMRLDGSELWTVVMPVPGGRIGLGNVLTHELGHFWGYGHHNGDTNSLMDAFYDPSIDAPRARDVAAMQSLYPGTPAMPPGDVPPTPTPTPPPGGRVASFMDVLDQNKLLIQRYLLTKV